MGPSVEPSASPEPRWPAAVAILAMLLLVLNLPPQVELFPRWFPYAAVSVMLAPMALVAASHGHPSAARLERALIFLTTGTIGIVGVVTLTVVIRAMLFPSGAVNGLALLASSVTLWVTNIVIASLLYWQLDRGGPAGLIHRIAIAPDWRFPTTNKPKGTPCRGCRLTRTICSPC